MLFEPPVFETIFRIPVHHRLVITSSRSRGGPADGVRWFHDEFDGAGALAARYETYDETDEAGRSRCGWRKLDAAGRVTMKREVGMRWASLVVAHSSRRAAERAIQAPEPLPRRASHGIAA
ncbi:MAG: hypothetical protein PGN34_24410 [Methylobacterium frigidaeris]